MEKLGDISAQVMHQIELSTWMITLVSIQVEYQVVEDYEFLTKTDLSIDLVRSVLFHFLRWLRGHNLALGVVVTNAVNRLKDDNKHDESAQAERCIDHSIIAI